MSLLKKIQEMQKDCPGGKFTDGNTCAAGGDGGTNPDSDQNKYDRQEKLTEKKYGKYLNIANKVMGEGSAQEAGEAYSEAKSIGDRAEKKRVGRILLQISGELESEGFETSSRAKEKKLNVAAKGFRLMAADLGVK